jgi:hypothetical protein
MYEMSEQTKARLFRFLKKTPPVSGANDKTIEE